MSFNEKVEIKRNSKEKHKLKYINTVCKLENKNIDKRAFLEVIRQIKDENPKKYTQGKFELWFFVSFCNNLLETMKKSGKRIKIRTNIGINNAIEILGPRLNQPAELKSFLTNRFKSMN